MPDPDLFTRYELLLTRGAVFLLFFVGLLKVVIDTLRKIWK